MSNEDRTSEQEMIGVALMTGELHELTMNHFVGRDHQEIWLAMQTIKNNNHSITLKNVLNVLKKNKSQVSALYLSELSERVVPNLNVELRISSLEELKNKRDIINTIEIVNNKLENPLAKAQDLAEYLIEKGKGIARVTHRGKSLTQEVRDLISETKGDISVTDVRQSVAKRDINPGTIRKLLSRLAKEGLIEPTKKGGVYRIVDASLEEINFMEVKDNELDFHWPMQIEQFFRLMPKNIVIVAGEPDSGKTAFLLNTAALNMKRGYKVKYFSSEMGALELRSRLEQWAYVEDDPDPLQLEDWNNDNFKVYERMTDFADVIDPHGVNIIDFLEIHNEFYRVSEYIREIFDKLITGVAIIAIQKNAGALWGLGGQRTIEKARLAVNLSNDGYAHSAQLIKVKNWRNPQDNPNYMKMEYSLVRGCYFKPQSSWVKEYPRQGESHEQSNANGKAIQRTRVEVHTERNGGAQRFNRNFGKA